MADVNDLKVGSQAYESALADLTAKQYATNVEGHLQRLEDAKTVIVAKTHDFVALDLENGSVTLDDAAIALSNIVNHGVKNETISSNSYAISAGYYAGGTITISGDGAFKLQALTGQTIGEDGSTRSKTFTKTDSDAYGLSSVTVTIDPKFQNVEEVTAVAGDVLAGKKFVAKDGTVVTGSIPTQDPNATSNVLSINAQTKTFDAGYYANSFTVGISAQEKSVEGINNQDQIIEPDSGKVLSKVVVPGVDTVEFSQPELYTLANPQVFHVTATVKDTNGNEVINKVNSLSKSSLSLDKASEVGTDGIITTSVSSSKGYTEGESKSSTYNLKEKVTLSQTETEPSSPNGNGEWLFPVVANVKASNGSNVAIASHNVAIPSSSKDNQAITVDENGNVSHSVVLGKGYEYGQTVTQTLSLPKGHSDDYGLDVVATPESITITGTGTSKGKFYIDDLEIERTISTQAKSATPSTAEQTITADEGQVLGSVKISGVEVNIGDMTSVSTTAMPAGSKGGCKWTATVTSGETEITSDSLTLEKATINASISGSVVGNEYVVNAPVKAGGTMRVSTDTVYKAGYLTEAYNNTLTHKIACVDIESVGSTGSAGYVTETESAGLFARLAAI